MMDCGCFANVQFIIAVFKHNELHFIELRCYYLRLLSLCTQQSNEKIKSSPEVCEEKEESVAKGYWKIVTVDEPLFAERGHKRSEMQIY